MGEEPSATPSAPQENPVAPPGGEAAAAPQEAPPEPTLSETAPGPAEPILTALQALHERIDRHLQDTAAYQRDVFDRLYEEMKTYRDDFLLKATRSLLIDIMLLYDSIERALEHYSKGDAVSLQEVTVSLQTLLIETEEVLARQGVTRIIEHGEKLVRETQKAVKTIPTDDPNQDMAITTRVKAGFMRDDMVFRREEVIVSKYVPDVAPQPDAAPK